MPKRNMEVELEKDPGPTDLLEGEIFKPLISPLYPYIKPCYVISNKGRVYNRFYHRFLSSCTTKSVHGLTYRSVNLQQIDRPYYSKGCVSFILARIVLVIFSPVEDMEDLRVVYLDGNHENVDLSNLAWGSISKSVAEKRGLHYIVRDTSHHKNYSHNFSKTPREKIVKFCELYQSGKYTKAEAAELAGISYGTATGISNNGSWQEISKNYDFSKRMVTIRPLAYDIDDLHIFCKYFQDHKKPEDLSARKYVRDMLIELGYIKDRYDIDKGFLDSVYNVYRKKHFKKITALYDF